MNAERIHELAEVIERTPLKPIVADAKNRRLDGFNIAKWHCGTVGCIAGWAHQLWGKRKLDEEESYEQARLILGLSTTMANSLFMPSLRLTSWGDITPNHAAAVLRHLAETGEVDWSVGASLSQVQP